MEQAERARLARGRLRRAWDGRRGGETPPVVMRLDPTPANATAGCAVRADTSHGRGYTADPGQGAFLAQPGQCATSAGPERTGRDPLAFLPSCPRAAPPSREGLSTIQSTDDIVDWVVT
jgi:hypothetical protein